MSKRKSNNGRGPLETHFKPLGGAEYVREKCLEFRSVRLFAETVPCSPAWVRWYLRKHGLSVHFGHTKNQVGNGKFQKLIEKRGGRPYLVSLIQRCQTYEEAEEELGCSKTYMYLLLKQYGLNRARLNKDAKEQQAEVQQIDEEYVPKLRKHVECVEAPTDDYVERIRPLVTRAEDFCDLILKIQRSITRAG